MRAYCLVLLILGCSLPSVLCDSHLDCPADRACPVSTAPTSNAGTGMCNDGVAAGSRGNIRDSTTLALTGYLSSDNEFFERRRDAYVGQNNLFPASSCAEIISTFPSSVSGYYWVGGSQTYCRFDLDTPDGEEAWERVAYLNMSDPMQMCPGTDFKVVEPPQGRGRYCVKRGTEAGCQGFTVSPGTTGFSRVFGRVTGIQIGSGDAIESSASIDDAYLDGVSLTTNNAGNRQHIWSFTVSNDESDTGCPCSTGSTTGVPGFVGPDYFCESGQPVFTTNFQTAWVDDPLWDGEQCNFNEAPCCMGTIGSARSPPWFYKTFNDPFPSGTSLEVRVCTDQDINDENMGLQLVELYVQ